MIDLGRPPDHDARTDCGPTGPNAPGRAVGLSPYRRRVDTVLRETHYHAILAMVGPHVYKVKKTVRLPFLDFSTVEARWAVAA